MQEKHPPFSVIGIIITGVILALLNFIPEALAQTPSVLNISPLNFEITINPGESISDVVKVSNLGDYPIQVKMEAEDFTSAGESGEVVVKEELNTTYSLAKWIIVTPETIVLEPHSQTLVSFAISIPSDGEPGGHYGTILASITGGGALGGASVVQKVGSLLLVQVAGETKELLWVKEFKAPYFSEYGPIQLTTRLENQGTVHIKPRGFISITNLFGKEAANLPFDQKNILPQSIRTINTTWNKNLLFGKYTATLAAIYGLSNEPLSAVISFWVIPWKILGVSILILLVLGIFFYKTRKRWKMALKILVKGEGLIKEEPKKAG
jgi:hypothetical protein